MSKTRSIFEEVGTAEKPVAVPSAERRPPRGGARGAVAVWLMLLFLLVALMIVIGGLTRLTDSGLSITEWKPVTGALPPMDAAAWTAEFDKYRATPQATIQNPTMTLGEFQAIYWWEWGHRQLGRLIGAVWGLGFLYFLVRRQIPPGWVPRLLGLGLLGGLQGAIGWWMVSSGLTGAMVSVASYRLAVHLGIGFTILGLIAWSVLLLQRSEGELLQARRQRNLVLARWGLALVAIAFVQVLLGALVAGIDAGRNFPEWPLMGGQLFPAGAFDLVPAWRNFLDNPGLVQFNHRMMAYLLLGVGIAAWWRSRSSALGGIRRAYRGALHMMLLQLALGIATALYGAPWQVAILHQIGAMVLFVLILRARFSALYPRPERIARGT